MPLEVETPPLPFLNSPLHTALAVLSIIPPPLIIWLKRAVRRQPYAGFVYFHLILAGLTESGEMRQEGAAQFTG
jgi:hypothetical protein